MLSQIPRLSVRLGLPIAIVLQIYPTVVQANDLATKDIPEEVLRAEIITEARSPIDGKPLSAIGFAELVIQVEQKTANDDAVAAAATSPIKNLLFLIRLRAVSISICLTATRRRRCGGITFSTKSCL